MKNLSAIGRTGAMLVLACLLAQPGFAADASNKNDANSQSIGLGNADEDDAAMPAAPAASEAGAAEQGAKAGDASVAGEAKKVDPLTQHRMNMLQQVDPSVYMGANQAVSRRYLMIDKSTYKQRLEQ